VIGNLLFTQEQAGPPEAVVCQGTRTGREIWRYEDEVRFGAHLHAGRLRAAQST